MANGDGQDINRRSLLKKLGSASGTLAAYSAYTQTASADGYGEGSGELVSRLGKYSERTEIFARQTELLREQLVEKEFLESADPHNFDLRTKLDDQLTVSAELDKEGYRLGRTTNGDKNGARLTVSYLGANYSMVLFVFPISGRSYAVVNVEDEERIIDPANDTSGVNNISSAGRSASASSSGCSESTRCETDGCSCFSSDPIYRQEKKEITQRCCWSDANFTCWIVSEGGCGTCDPDTGYGSCP